MTRHSSSTSSSNSLDSLISSNDKRDNLLKLLKKEVKMIMEESVMLKTIHENSSTVTSLCAIIDTILSIGLKKRALGLFKTSSTTALMKKLAKENSDIDTVIKKVNCMEINKVNRTLSVGESSTTPRSSSLQKANSGSNLMIGTTRYIWIRIALFDKVLQRIVAYLVDEGDRFYSKDSLISDPDYGPILSSLLVGPCALEYSKIRPHEHSWFDLSANELVQRHKISSGSSVTSGNYGHKSKRSLCQSFSVSNSIGLSVEGSSIPFEAREYVESLHQNQYNVLLFGKNNVTVLPMSSQIPVIGYLSLHRDDYLYIKWTPNKLMNSGSSLEDKNASWQQAVSVEMNSIHLLHCHQGSDEYGTLYLVARDGTQHPPLRFPPGGHLMQFMTILEASLPPFGYLNPSLESFHFQSSRLTFHSEETSTQKSRHLLQRLRKNKDVVSSDNYESPRPFPQGDYLFKILLSNSSINYHQNDSKIRKEWLSNWFRNSAKNNSIFNSSQSQESLESSLENCEENENQCSNSDEPLSTLCTTMKRQIISRAFYGWLSYCKNLKTIRQSLSGLAFKTPIYGTDLDYKGVTIEAWKEFIHGDKHENDVQGMYHKIYFGGISPEIRYQVWPYLLGHYEWSFSQFEKEELDVKTRSSYEHKCSDWMAIDAIVQQRDKENTANNIAKLSRCFSDNDVFESLDEETSSRTLSQDKISTITEVTENSTSNSEKSRCKLLSTQSEPETSDVIDEGIEDRGSRSDDQNDEKRSRKNGITYKVTTPSVDSGNVESFHSRSGFDDLVYSSECILKINRGSNSSRNIGINESRSMESSNCPSPLSSEGIVFSEELVDNFAINLHRIDKDVLRCDRNIGYFNSHNLEKLRNIVTTYVWDNLDVGYMQGMCDLVAPLLVLFDDESLTHSCFVNIMERMLSNFPQGAQMDDNFANMRYLIQVLDQNLFDKIQRNDDFSHFYFCYRWFLLDFKREFTYSDIYLIWETIWASSKVSSLHFYLFVALGLVENYRNIILDRNMDFTDIIKFFNEMAEKHDGKQILTISRDFVVKLQQMTGDDK